MKYYMSSHEKKINTVSPSFSIAVVDEEATLVFTCQVNDKTIYKVLLAWAKKTYNIAKGQVLNPDVTKATQ